MNSDDEQVERITGMIAELTNEQLQEVFDYCKVTLEAIETSNEDSIAIESTD